MNRMCVDGLAGVCDMEGLGASHHTGWTALLAAMLVGRELR